MNRNSNIALVTLALGVWVSAAAAQTLLYTTGFTNTAGWVASGPMTFSLSNDQFLATGTYSTYFHTNDPWAAYGDAYHPIPTSGPLPDNQTLEARVDLVGVNQNDVWADLHVWGDPYAATYAFYTGPDGVALLKAWNWATSWAVFFYEDRPLKNTNVTLVLALTRRGSNLEINTRILDKDNGNAVLFDRLVIDTPQSDPVVPSRGFRNLLSWPDPAGTPPPVLRAPAAVCLGVGWLNPTNGPWPAAQVVYDNVEVWLRPAPRPYVVSWGADSCEATFVPFGLSNLVAVAAGAGTSMALRNDGTVVAWGGETYNTPPPLSDVVAIAAGGTVGFFDLKSHSLALRADGTVVLWGKAWGGTNGWSIPLTWVPEGLTNVVAVAGGYFHSLALRSDGTVVAWESPEYGFDTNLVSQVEAVPADLTNAVAVAGGANHSLALREDGTVVAWGGGDYGEANVPAGLSNVVAIAAGSYHCLALRGDGTVAAWGSYWTNGMPNGTNVPATVPSGLTNVVAIAAGAQHCLALGADGTIVAWGGSFMCGNWDPATSVPAGLTNVMAIAGGSCHDLVLVGDGPPLMQARLTHPTVDANGFSVSVPTQSGRVYRLEYKNSLADTDWTALPLVAGTGQERTLTDPTASEAQRFYRVRQW